MYFRVYRTNLAQETIHKSWAHAHMATPISSPYASGWIFLFRPRKVVETFRIQQNVCNGHVYIQLMKQRILQNAFFLRYSRKTDFFPPNAFLRRRRKKALLRVNDRGGGWKMCILALRRVCVRARGHVCS